MYSVKVTAAEKLFIQSDGSEILAVDFDVLKDSEFVVHYSHGFPLATTSEEINSYLKDFVDNYSANSDRAEANAERDAAQKVADDTIAQVVGIEIKN